MQVSSQTNNYQALNSYQNRQETVVTTPVEPQPTESTKPTTSESPGDVYQASDGNVIADREGNLSVTPQGQNNINNAVDNQQAQTATAEQDKKDAQRGVAVDYTASQSKKSQMEIAMAVASDNQSSVANNETAAVVETLRDVQQQNNNVQAYATYKENQNSSMLGLIA